MKKLSEKEILQKLEKLENWEYKNEVLHAKFKLKDFKEAFAVMTQIAIEAEALNHHPDWKNVFNEVEISLSTHDANGITQKDFDLAKAIDKIIDNK
ncbi:4a-hydroxytetrahydrobiopterin dehydratase [Mesonia sp. K7]|uniref:4a-hydroxytetrahydrobiopterin dehydratase n=1 Tax=Mesonia sp. K7 TaxID=2218606 RepID=UPI000DA70E3B|nr:4a-hydroxytetrahydrobiopterin dehydratase [Mesonia sp. K7]PZD79427.1 4a-hydroxytetrahydrobiopterin dehydratase [Mesonia sp. K7]